ncbi:uncharacterized protein [Branchiostoma lanceolatum]|uniref:uncharacterized protein n=1 Tax=Branchiostoma lanceolatum TaxID=7740 RepID=UPI003452D468
MRQSTNDVILGWPFCRSHNIAINPTSGTAKIGSSSVPLLSRPPLAPPVSDAFVCRTTILPPNSVSKVPVRLSSSRGDPPCDFVGVFERDPRRVTYDGVATARTVANVQQGCSMVQVLNTNNHPVRIPERINIGQFHATSDPDAAYTIADAADTLPVVPPTQKAKVRVPKTSLPVIDLSDIGLPQPQLQELSDCLEANRDCFSTGSFDLGRTDLVQHRIDTGDAAPIKQRPYRTPVHRREVLRNQIAEMLDHDVIEPSTSPWASPVVIVTKKDGSPRFCVDYRKLNAVTVPDAHPLPRIDDTLDAMAGSCYFSTLDMRSAYWQVPVHPDDRHKTAFITSDNLWQFKRLPFGLMNSGATFQRLVQLCLAGVGWDVCLAYLDDSVVFTRTFDDHLHALQEVFTRFRRAGLKLNPAKCRFAQQEVTFLGHVVSRHGVAPDPANTCRVRDWPTPTCQKDARSFLGLASFYRKFVPGFATVAEPLVRLTDKNHRFKWTPACQTAFEHLKTQLTSPPLLAFPDFSREFYLATDASTFDIGAVLTQDHGTTRCVVAYASKTLSKTQRRWSTYDREFWAAVWAIRQFRPYLYGRQFQLSTDHRPLLSCRDTPLGDGITQERRTRWAIELSTYEFDIQYRPGCINNDADALSRRPPSPTPADAAPEDVILRDAPSRAEVPPPPVSTPAPDVPSYAEAQAVVNAREDHGFNVAAPAPDVPSYAEAQEATDSDDDRDRDYGDQPTAAHVRSTHLATTPAIDFLEAQLNDTTLREVRRWLQDGAGQPPVLAARDRRRDLLAYHHEFDSLFLKDDLLYRQPTDLPPTAAPQLVLPRALADRVLPSLHDDTTTGHFGPARTLRRARDRFYWPGMTLDVARYCRECASCQQRRPPVPTPRAPFRHIVATRPFETVATDITYMPLSTAGNKYVLVVSDIFTKYVNLYAIPRQDAATVADKLFRDFIGQHGVPDLLHSDQGPQYESHLISELCTRLGIRKSRTSPYHHTERSYEVFTRFRRAGLKLNPAKCRFAQQEVTFLGHVVSRHGVAPDPANTCRVRDWPTPTCQKDARSFLGLASFYRKFVPGFATVAEPLVRLTDKNHRFKWTPACQTAFEHLKTQLTSPPLLAFPDFSREFYLATDASTFDIGAVLTQDHGTTRCVVAYASKTLSKTQRRWSTYDREFWAAVWAIRQFRPYLYGRQFQLSTDHRPLLSCRDTPLGDGITQERRTRWAIELSTYEFDIQYRPGCINNDADALSRRPPSPTPADAAPEDVILRDAPSRAEVPPPPVSTPAPDVPSYAEAQAVVNAREDHGFNVAAPAPDVPSYAEAQEATDSDDDRDRDYGDQPTAAHVRSTHLATTPAIDFLEAQLNDTTLREVRRWLQDGAGQPPVLAARDRRRDLLAYHHEFDSLFLKDDLLYRQPTDLPPTAAPQLVLPRALADRVLPSLHDDTTTGHFGPARTLRRARDRFYWPGMTLDVARYCRECASCQQRRPPVPTPRAPFRHIVATRPFETVATDITYMPLSTAGNKYVLVVSDIFTKYVNLYAIPRQDAATVADKLFRDFIGQHGVPDLLHSDQGPQYESHLISELCTRLGIRKSRTSPYHPQGDGQVERFNRTMKDILAKCLAGRENDWDRILPHVALAYNTSLHTTTKRSPFYLVHGREARLPVDVACQLPATTAHLADLTTAITSVRDAIAQSHQTQDQQQAPRVNYHQYRVGDRVWLHHPPSALYKLRLPWTGPFTVIATLPPGEPAPILYRIQHDTGRQRQQVVHHNRLKPYIAPTRRLLPAPPAAAPDNRRRLPDAGHLGFAGFLQQHHLRPPDLPAAQPDPPPPAPVPVQLPAVPAPAVRTRSGRISRPPTLFMDLDYN